MAGTMAMTPFAAPLTPRGPEMTALPLAAELRRLPVTGRIPNCSIARTTSQAPKQIPQAAARLGWCWRTWRPPTQHAEHCCKRRGVGRGRRRRRWR